MMAKRKEIPEWMKNYYANSAGGSVIKCYEEGRVTILNADATSTERKEESDEIKQADAELRALTDEIDKRYWVFTRCRGAGISALNDPELYVKRNAARERLLDLRRKA
jgi:hypothetical protein